MLRLAVLWERQFFEGKPKATSLRDFLRKPHRAYELRSGGTHSLVPVTKYVDARIIMLAGAR